MIEIMLVVVIMMLAAVVAIPSMTRSFAGARLRASSRTVVMSHRFARSTAVLKQKSMALLFDTAKNQVEIVSVADARNEQARNRFLDDRGAGLAGDEAGSASVESEAVRSLGEHIRIASFSSDRSDQEVDGIYWVNYHPNGMCDDFRIELRDENNKGVAISVDPYSGAVSSENRR
jgi:Tfp pilus assembly protein FimT